MVRKFGEIDVNHWPGYRTVIWWQDTHYTVNVRLVSLPPW